MADFMYTRVKNSWLIQSVNVPDMDADNINASLVRASTYTPNQATDEFYDDVTTPVQEADGFLSITVAANTENVDAADFVFSAVPAGAELDQMVIWKDTAVDATSRLIVFYDISVIPIGTDINVTVSGSGLFDL